MTPLPVFHDTFNRYIGLPMGPLALWSVRSRVLARAIVRAAIVREMRRSWGLAPEGEFYVQVPLLPR